MAPACQVILAPSQEAQRHPKSLFLAGSTSGGGDWRKTVVDALRDVPITVYNPLRPDWDSSWREDVTFAPFKEQVQWELEKQDEADIVAVFFHPSSKAPVTLLELGLCARSGKTIVGCPQDYWKSGNIRIVCQRYGIPLLSSDQQFVAAVLEKSKSL